MPNRYDYLREVQKSDVDEIEEVQKFNPYHGYHGYFSTAENSTYFQIRTKDPSKQHWADMAIERAKQRYAESQASSTPKKVKVKVKNPNSSQSGPSQPKENFVNACGKDYAKYLEQTVADSPEVVRKVWDKYGDKIRIDDIYDPRECYIPGEGIHIHMARDLQGDSAHAPHEVTLHESGHAIDEMLGKRFGTLRTYFGTNIPKSYAEFWNNGEFSKTLKQETKSYIQNYQKKLSEKRHTRVPIEEARKELAFEMSTKSMNNARAYHAVSDIMGGATNGAFRGPYGHSKAYWTGDSRSYGHDVSVEAFAHMFSAGANSESLGLIQEIYPKSYGLFLQMLEEA